MEAQVRRYLFGEWHYSTSVVPDSIHGVGLDYAPFLFEAMRLDPLSLAAARSLGNVP